MRSSVARKDFGADFSGRVIANEDRILQQRRKERGHDNRYRHSFAGAAYNRGPREITSRVARLEEEKCLGKLC